MAVIAISDLIADFDEDDFEEAFSILSTKNKDFGLLWSICIMIFSRHFPLKWSEPQEV